MLYSFGWYHRMALWWQSHSNHPEQKLAKKVPLTHLLTFVNICQVTCGLLVKAQGEATWQAAQAGFQQFLSEGWFLATVLWKMDVFKRLILHLPKFNIDITPEKWMGREDFLLGSSNFSGANSLFNFSWVFQMRPGNSTSRIPGVPWACRKTPCHGGLLRFRLERHGAAWCLARGQAPKGGDGGFYRWKLPRFYKMMYTPEI